LAGGSLAIQVGVIADYTFVYYKLNKQLCMRVETQMFLVQTGRAKRTGKYPILMILVLLLLVSPWGILTLHWDVLPKKKERRRGPWD
jgi:hypothetical protein